MCLIVFAVSAHPRHRLVLAANRDELHARPTSPAAFWKERGDIFAGRDLTAGGTWLGVTRSGRLAALTNVRSPDARREGRSRGLVVRSVLEASDSAAMATQRVAEERSRYPSFNLLAVDGSGAFALSDGGLEEVRAGVHGLSNARLDTPWPKVARGRERLEAALTGNGTVDTEALFALLADRSTSPDEALPSTGVALSIERMLSAAFIVSPVYGTRSSTVVLIGQDGAIDFEERSFSPAGEVTGVVHEVIQPR